MTRVRAMLILALIALPALFAGLGRRDLWNPTEPRYAGIAAELLREGHWLVPTYNGRLYDQKPALYFWLTAAALDLGEGREARLFLVRLPSALGALLLALATFALGRRLFDAETGLLGGAMILTSWLGFWSGRFCHMDTLNAACLAFALHGLLARAGGGSRLHVVEAALGLAGGLLLKGPSVLAFTFGTALAASLPRSCRGFLARSGLPIALPAAIVLAGLWFLPAALSAGPDWVRSLLVDAGIFHLVDPTNAEKHDATYYAAVIWGVAAPWSLLLPAALLGRWRSWRQGLLAPGEAQGLVFLLGWIVAVALVLHLGSTYRSRYLLTLFPPLMLVLARSLLRDLGAGGPAAVLGRLGLGLGLAAMLAASLAMLLPDTLAGRFTPSGLGDFLGELGRSGGALVVLGILTAAIAFVGAARLVAGRVAVAAAALVGAVALAFAAWGLCGAPAMDRVHGDRELLAAVRAELPGRRLAAIRTYGFRESTEGYYGFELGRPLLLVPNDTASLADWHAGEPLLLLLRERDLEALEPGALADWTPLAEEAFGRHRVRLFSNDGRAGSR